MAIRQYCLSLPARQRTLFRIFFSMLMLVFALAGCNSTEDHSGDAQIRYVNLSVDINSIDIKTGSNADSTAHTDATFATATSYDYMNAGTIDFTIEKSSDNTAKLVNDVSLSLTKQVPYTLFYYGENNSTSSYALINDSQSAPSSGYISVRVLDYAPGVSSLDVYITSPTASLTSAAASVSSMTAGSDSGYVNYTNGSFRIRATLTGTKQVVYDSGTLSSNDQEVIMIALYTSGSGKLVNAMRLPVNGNNGAVQIANNLSQVKFVNASANAGQSELSANGTAMVSSVPFGGISSYVTTSSGNRSLSLISSTNTAAATLDQTFNAAIDYSVVAVDNGSSEQLLTFTDNNLPPSSGNAKIRFINVAQNTGAVDGLANFVTQASALAANSASSYVQVGAGTFSFTFNLSNTNTTEASLTGQTIDAGDTYTVYLIGNTGSYQVVMTRDN